MWPPPFLPPPFPVLPPPVVIPDVHFVPIPPPAVMTFLPSMSPVAIPLQVPLPPAPPQASAPVIAPAQKIAPTPAPAPAPAPSTKPTLPPPLGVVGHGYQTITTTTFIPVGTLAEFCSQRPEEKATKHQSVDRISNSSRDCLRTHPLVINNFYGPMTIFDRHPEEIGDVGTSVGNHRASSIPTPTCASPAAPKKEKRCNVTFPQNVEKPQRTEKSEGLKAGGKIELPPHECKAPNHPLEASSGLGEKACKEKHLHHHHQGAAYDFPFLVTVSPMTLPTPEQVPPTLAAVTEIQDAIQRPEQTCQVPVKESKVIPTQPYPETKSTAACPISDDPKPEKPQHQSVPVLAPAPTTKDSKPVDEGPPQLQHSFCALQPPVYHYDTHHLIGGPPFPQQPFGPQYNFIHVSYLPVNTGLPYQRACNHSLAYQATGQSYPAVFHPVTDPGIHFQYGPGLSRRAGKWEHKRTCKGCDVSSLDEGQKGNREERNGYNAHGCQGGSIPCEPDFDVTHQEWNVLEQETQEKNTETHQKYNTHLQSNKQPKLRLLSTCSSSPSSATSSSEAALASVPGTLSKQGAKNILISKGKNKVLNVISGDISTLSQRVVTSIEEKAERVGSLVGGARQSDLHLTAQERTKAVDKFKATRGITTQHQNSLQVGLESSCIESVGISPAFTLTRPSCPAAVLPTFPDNPSFCIRKNILASDPIAVAETVNQKVCPLSTFSEPTPLRLFPASSSILHNLIDSGNEGDISGEESNTEQFGEKLLDMDEKEVFTSLPLPPIQEEDQRKCNCKCCGKRRERKDKQKAMWIEDAKKRGKKKDKSERKKESLYCHQCKLRNVGGEPRLKQGEIYGCSSKRGMLRDIALGACAGGLGYLVGTMVDRRQTKGRRYPSAHKSHRNGTAALIAAVGSAHESQVVSDTRGTYTVSEIPPTPPPAAHVPSSAFAKPVYPGWNDSHYLQQSGDSCLRKETFNSFSKSSQKISTTGGFHHRHRLMYQHHQDWDRTRTISLPEEMATGPRVAKEENVRIVINIRNAEGGRKAVESGKPSLSTGKEITQSAGMHIHEYEGGAFMRGTKAESTGNKIISKQEENDDGGIGEYNLQAVGAKMKTVPGFYLPAHGRTNIDRYPARPVQSSVSSLTPGFPIPSPTLPLQPPVTTIIHVISDSTPDLIPILSSDYQSSSHEHILPFILPAQPLPLASMPLKEQKTPSREKSEHRELVFELESSESEVCKGWNHRNRDSDTRNTMGMVDPPLRMSMRI